QSPHESPIINGSKLINQNIGFAFEPGARTAQMNSKTFRFRHNICSDRTDQSRGMMSIYEIGLNHNHGPNFARLRAMCRIKISEKNSSSAYLHHKPSSWNSSNSFKTAILSERTAFDSLSSCVRKRRRS